MASAAWLDELRRMLEQISASDATEVEVAADGFRLRLVRRPGRAAVRVEARTVAAIGELSVDGTPLVAPLTGVFYRSASPGTPPLVSVGDRVEATFDGRQGIIDHLFAARAFSSVVILFERLGRAEAAATIFGALRTVVTSPDGVPPMLEEVVDRLREVLGAASFSDLEQRGRTLTVPDAADYAQEQIRLALQDLGESREVPG